MEASRASSGSASGAPPRAKRRHPEGVGFGIPVSPVVLWCLLLALGGLLLIPQLFSRDIWGPDETRFAEVTREMIVSRDYLVPHLNGGLYSEKPPLFFWFSAAVWGAFGPDSCRVVALAAALAVLVLTGCLAAKLNPQTQGLWPALVCLTTLLFTGLARCGILDSLLLLATLAAVSCGVAALECSGRRAGVAWLGCYAATALAILTKGPVGLMTVAIVLASYAVLRRKQVRLGGWWHLAGALVFAALVAGWLVPAIMSGGREYADRIIFQQTLQRVRGTATHYEPFYFYLVRWPLYFFPWSLLLPVAFAWALRSARRGRNPGDAFPALWLVALLVAFSLIGGKRERYILPTAPAVAILVGRYISDVAGELGEREGLPWPGLHRLLFVATFLIVLLLAAALLGVAGAPASVLKPLITDPQELSHILSELTLVPRAVFAAAGLIIASLGLWALSLPFRGAGEPFRAALLVACMVTLSVAADFGAVPMVNRLRSDKRLVQGLKPYLDSADEVYLLRADFGGIANLYTGRLRIPVLSDDRALAEALASPRRVAVVAWGRQARQRPQPERSHLVRCPAAPLRDIALIINWEPGSSPPMGARE